MNQPQHNRNFKVDKSTLVNLEKGKVPPQAIDLEEVVLGAMLIDKKGIDIAFEVLNDNSDVFYKEAHQHIFIACLELYAINEPIDLLTVSTQLKKNGKLEISGGDFYLIGLTQKVSSSAHIEFHCRILMQKYAQRQAIKVSSKIIEFAYDDQIDVFELLDKAHRDIEDTSKWLLRKAPTDLKNAYDNFLTEKESGQNGIPSKLLSKKLSYYPGDLVIYAGRPGMGKTALALNEAKFIAEQNIPVGFISLEMMTNQIIGRLVANEFEIDADRVKKGGRHLTPSEKEVIKKEGVKIKNLPFHIHDEGGLNTMAAKTIIGKWVRKDKVKIVFIDYLQLMKGYGNNWNGNREQEIAHISGSLKSWAKEFEIPIIALSQLSRAVETRGGSKRPLLSDLRESGAIEQDADVVGFVYRPEYYKIENWDDEERSPTKDQCEIDLAKIREGELGYTRLKCQLRYMKMERLEETPWTPMDLPKIQPRDAFYYDNDSKRLDEEDDGMPF